MSRRMNRTAILALLAGLVLGACATPPQLYYWGNYEPQVYENLRKEGRSTADQIVALEKTVQQAKAANKPLPPGFQAHLGMLYLAEGKSEQMRLLLENEKAAFPESAGFMDFLLTRIDKRQMEGAGK